MSDAKSSRPSQPTVRRDLYQEVTDKLIAAIEAGTAPWQRPWQDVAAAGVPMNGTSSRPYNGVNALLLMMTAQAEGYSDNRWFTFEQANAMGAKVLGLHAATNPHRSGPYSDRRYCVDRYDDAARKYRGTPASALKWGTKIEADGVMDLITVDDAIAAFERYRADTA